MGLDSVPNSPSLYMFTDKPTLDGLLRLSKELSAIKVSVRVTDKPTVFTDTILRSVGESVGVGSAATDKSLRWQSNDLHALPALHTVDNRIARN